MHKSNVASPWKQERWRGSRWPVWHTARDTWPTAGPEQRWAAPTCPARFLESNIKEKTTNETSENLHLRIQHTQAFVVRQCGICLVSILQHLLQSGHQIFIFLNTEWEGQEELTRGAKKSLTVKELFLSLLLIYSFACAWLNWTKTESEFSFPFFFLTSIHVSSCQIHDSSLSWSQIESLSCFKCCLHLSGLAKSPDVPGLAISLVGRLKSIQAPARQAILRALIG